MATSIAAQAIFAASAKTLAPASSGAAAASAPFHDCRRAWLWCFLAIVAASQLYFVRELFAAFAIFAIIFTLIAIVVVSLYMLASSAELAFLRFSALRNAGTLANAPNMAPVASLASVVHGEHSAV